MFDSAIDPLPAQLAYLVVILVCPAATAMSQTKEPVKTFRSMTAEAYAAVPTSTPAELQRRLQEEPDLLVIDVRDSADVAQTGTLPGAVNIS